MGRVLGKVTGAAAALALCVSLGALVPGLAQASSYAKLKPPITKKLIPFGNARKAQTADYGTHHYHQHTCWLTNPKVIVLHFTAGSNWLSAWNTFAANTAYTSTPGKPEKPGVSAHFIVRKDGVIIQAVPLSLRARHAIGMNWKAIGIEFVQEVPSGKNGHWADRQILARKKQIRAGLRLVRYLRARYRIKKANVIGHAMANDSPYFKDYTGAKNATDDWYAKEVRVFRARL
jgi:N-acetylmuramoyl-L-alanine amidase